jgi:hypothetical protein
LIAYKIKRGGLNQIAFLSFNSQLWRCRPRPCTPYNPETSGLKAIYSYHFNFYRNSCVRHAGKARFTCLFKNIEPHYVQWGVGG